MGSRHGAEEVTRLLRDAGAGDRGAADRLLPLVYDELRGLAARTMRGERVDHTLQPTALVHEAYLKLVDQRDANWNDRTHFVAVAATAFRRIVVDHARRRSSEKRGGGMRRAPTSELRGLTVEAPDEVLAIDEALSRLADLDARKARVVELRFFGGLELDEVAHVLSISRATVKRDWAAARAWLQTEIAGEEE